MKRRFVMAILGALFLALSQAAGPQAAWAQEDVTLLAPGSIRSAVEAWIPSFEKTRNMKVKVTFASATQVHKLVTDASAFDVAVVPPPLADVLAGGSVVTKSQTALGSVQIGLVFKSGTPKPDVSTADAAKKTLLAAKSVTYPSIMVDSIHDTLTKLGIVSEVQAKFQLATNGGAVLDNVREGDGEVGFAFLGEAKAPGVEVAGALPAGISEPMPLAAFLSARTKNPAAAQTLLRDMTSPAAADVYRANGMVPAH